MLPGRLCSGCFHSFEVVPAERKIAFGVRCCECRATNPSFPKSSLPASQSSRSLPSSANSRPLSPTNAALLQPTTRFQNLLHRSYHSRRNIYHSASTAKSPTTVTLEHSATHSTRGAPKRRRSPFHENGFKLLKHLATSGTSMLWNREYPIRLGNLGIFRDFLNLEKRWDS